MDSIVSAMPTTPDGSWWGEAMADTQTDRSNQHLFLLFALLVFYSLGPLVALIWALRSIGPGVHFEGELFRNIMHEVSIRPEAYTGILQQMIMPVAAAVTAAGYRTLLANRLSRWLFVIPLVGIVVCLSGAILFNSVRFSAALMESGKAEIDGSIGTVFLNSAGQLATYVMLLVGLQLAAPAGAGTITVASSETIDASEMGGLDELPPSSDDRGAIEWTDQAPPDKHKSLGPSGSGIG